MSIAFLTDGSSIAWLLSQPLFWAIASVIGGPCFFFAGLRALYQKRQIMNVPRSTIRGAAIGLVEVSGKAVGPYTVVAPLSGQECLYYRLVVVQDPDGKFTNKVREACAPLYIDDGTGLMMVYAPGSELRMQVSHQAGSLGQAMEGSQYGNDSTFVQEYVIKPGDQVFVMGTLTENRWTQQNMDGELSRIGPGFINRSAADLLRCREFSFLDPNLPSGEAPDPNLKFDLVPPAILMKGNGPFLISHNSQRDILTALGWKSLLYIWGAPLATLWGVWELVFVRPGFVNPPFAQ